MNRVRHFIFMLVTAALLSQPAVGQEPVYVGITARQFNYFASTQRNTEWCWAASIQMLFNYYGVDISQEQIVARSFPKHG
ncbi:MAG TPA: papain-like cysteine protease family protein, partial [Sphingobacteriaceae bacterium]